MQFDMWKTLGLLAAVGLIAACQTPRKKPAYLKQAEFLKHFAAESQTSATSTNGAEAGPRLIAPGMQLTISVEEERSLNRQLVVSPAGVIDFPGAGRISAVGLTSDELADRIRQPLEKDYFKKATVTVSVDTAPSLVPPGSAGVVYVMGAVQKPGPIALPSNAEAYMVLNAILAAGGLGQFADGSEVRLLRLDNEGKKIETRVNVSRIMKNGEFERDIPLRNGDWVVVPEKWISF